MPGPRVYTRSTLMALAHNSGGLCYYPGCPEPVLRKVENQWRFIVEIAHIRAAEEGGPRFDHRMTDDQRRDFSNLILFCDPHHDFVDDHPSIYNVEMLHRWKDQREAKPEEALARLREVTPAGLRKIVVESLEEHDERLLSAIQRLETSDAQAAALMRNLLDELTEAYSLQRRALNPDLVSEFSSAVSRFSRLAGSIELFDSAVRRYSRMPKRDW